MGKLFLYVLELSCFFLLLGVPLKEATAETAKRVLFISSYHLAFPTFSQQIEGIKSTFSANSIVLDVEFMDSKRFHDNTNLVNFHDSLTYKLSRGLGYDLVLTADDNALSFALKYQEELFSGLPIIFFGVNNFDTALDQNANPKVTGVVEAVSMLDTLQLIRRLHPETQSIVALADSTPSGQADLNTFFSQRAELDNIDLSEISLENLSFEEYAAQLRQVPDNTNILLLSAYKDKNGTSLLFNESLQLIRNNLPKPIYHLWYHGIGDGVLGGKLINHFDQAATAAKIALEVLSGKPVENIAVSTESPNRYIFDYLEMKRFGIDRYDLPQGSRIVNKPFSFYETNKKIVWATFIIFATLLALLIILSFNFIYRLRAEKEVVKAKEEWEKTFDSMSDIITIQDKDMRIVRANKAAHKVFHAKHGELNGKYCYQVFRNEDHPCPNCPECKTLTDRKTHGAIITHKNLGKIFHVTSSPILDENGEFAYLIHIAKDITEQKRIEEELFQAHKMEAIGTLAGGIAHDFNNILSAIIGFAELAKQGIPTDSDASEDIDEILNASIRAADLVQHILTFSRKSDHHLEPLAPHFIIKEAIKMMRASLPSTIQIETSIDSDCGKIMADQTNIHQIIVNLCTNALHSMENEKGVLRVSLYKKEISNEEIAGEPDVSSGSFIVLEVSDSGCGMDQATIEQIFDPYFTTKEVGKGTGLGLSVIHGIVKDYHGFIRVESEPGKGSTFHVYIPALQQEKSTMNQTKTDEPLPTGSEQILIVDDEKMIADINKRNLEQLGYKVTAVSQSLDALEKLRSDPDQFNLIITDQTMPNLTGAELAKEILKINPDMSIILCTGFSSVFSEQDALAIGIKKYVKKPLDRKMIAKVCRDVLDED